LGTPRVIAWLGAKSRQEPVNGIQLEGFRVIGSLEEHAIRDCYGGIDKLVSLEVAASPNERTGLREFVPKTPKARGGSNER